MRQRRQFDVASYLKAKTTLLSRYFSDENIEVCLVGVSGGIDSAVTLGILRHLIEHSPTPLSKVIPVLLPIHSRGATHQSIATKRGRRIAEHFNFEPMLIDLSFPLKTLQTAVDKASDITGNDWATGQLVSYLRTPALYYLASLQQQQQKKAVICGTTNRDEGAYIGFFGKASDGMVDIQVISDIHKSEVYQLAQFFQIPHEIQQAEPTGDTFDGQSDQEMLNVSYDFVELYTLWLCLTMKQQKALWSKLSPETQLFLEKGMACLEARHQRNQHKYFDGTPSIHMDVYSRAVPNGWHTRSSYHVNAIAIEPQNFVGYFQLDPKQVIHNDVEEHLDIHCSAAPQWDNHIFVVKNWLKNEEISALCKVLENITMSPANIHGYPFKDEYALRDIGSYRATTYNQQLADHLFERLLLTSFPRIKFLEDHSPTDGTEHPCWRLIGVNPVFRLIAYHRSGCLVPHYDAGYDFQDGKRHTLMSVLIYLTDHDETGTRFHWDDERHLPTKERCFPDHKQANNEDDVLQIFASVAGHGLIFDHRLLHDTNSIPKGQTRLVLRTDLIFERCGIHQYKNIFQKKSLQEKLLHRFGLSTWKNSKAIDQHYQNNTIENEVADRHYLWQLLRDPFYANAAKFLTSEEQLEEAGFFADARDLSDISYPRLWLCTPLEKIQQKLNLLRDNVHGQKKCCVLVTTGGFAPLHQGHVEMMELAKQSLEDESYTVLGGYFSPDHQTYVLDKCSDDTLSCGQRLHQCETMVETSDWLMIDPWQMFVQKKTVNFTTVVEYISSYLSAHIRSTLPIEVVYVCGADNARLALAFIARGKCLVVHRHGSEKIFMQYKQHDLIKGNSRILFCDRVPISISSTQLRESDSPINQQSIHRLRIRDEGEWALQHWKNLTDKARLLTAFDVFKKDLIALIEDTFDSHIDIHWASLKTQKETLSRWVRHSPIVSLDPCIEQAYNLGISRHFYCCSTAKNNSDFGPRPSTASLKTQIAKLPQGKITLLDDDIFTGKTIDFLKKILPKNREILAFYNKQKTPENQYDEICDLRDFLVGGYESGLTIILPNHHIASAPYMMPYVRPVYRLSIPAAKEWLFSLTLWKINLKFFESLDKNITIYDGHASLQPLAQYIGFSKATSMVDFCRWHIQHLSNGRE